MLAGAATRRQMTLLFCDIVGSTELADQRDPEEVTAVLERYRTACAEVVDELDGYIDDHRGDGMLVLFGYPQVDEDDARRGVLCGLRMIERVREIRWPGAKGAPPSGARLGAHRPGGGRGRHHRFDRQRGRSDPAARRPGHGGDQRHHPGSGVAVVRDGAVGCSASAGRVSIRGGVRRPRRPADSAGPDLAGPDQPVRQPYGGVLGHGVAGSDADPGGRPHRPGGRGPAGGSPGRVRDRSRWDGQDQAHAGDRPATRTPTARVQLLADATQRQPAPVPEPARRCVPDGRRRSCRCPAGEVAVRAVRAVRRGRWCRRRHVGRPPLSRRGLRHPARPVVGTE